MERKILVAVDGSYQSMNAVRYIGRLFPARNTEVVLLNIRIDVPESFFDLSKDPALRSRIASVNAWSFQMKNNAENFMEEANKILADSGFPPGSVKVKIQSKNAGIARDILKESRMGYSLVAVGRTGLSAVKDVIMGSIATKLIGKTPDCPVAVVGGDPDTNKILIGFDGSEGAMKAVKYAGRLLGDTDCDITLCYVIRPMGMSYGPTGSFYPEEEKWVTENTELIEPAFAEAEHILKNAGISSAHITTEILKRKISRAAAICHKAEEEGYDTIVVGRRGLTAVEEFVMGRVSTKVVNMAAKAAVWIV